MFGLFSNYLLLSLRNLKRQRIHALINILGLSLGLVVFILVFLFLVHEFSYDKSWREHQQIYRLNASLNFNGREDNFALSSYNMAESMKNDFPDIEAATMIFRTRLSNDDAGITVYHGDKMFDITSYTMADADFFKVFDYPFIEGDPNTALSEPKSLVISKKTAQKIFGAEPAYGELIDINTATYKVTGVINKEACQSHLHFDALISMSTMKQETFDRMKNDWFWLLGYTYIRFKDEAVIDAFSKKLELLGENTIKPWIQEVNVDGDIKMAIEPVDGIHFNNHLQYDSASNTNKRFVKMFAYIAVFLLLIASINYMNLATARSIKRAREIGIRKVAGAQKWQLIIQFLGESIFTAFFAFLLALLVAELVLPWFNNLIGMNLSLTSIFFANNIHIGLILLLIVFVLGLISGSFPAFVLSSFSPMDVLRSGSFSGKKQLFSASNLRKSLVVFQFVISISLIRAY